MEIGNIVRIKGQKDGPDLTVTLVSGENIQCMWWGGEEWKFLKININALEEATNEDSV